jgi:cell division septation protein DedD
MARWLMLLFLAAEFPAAAQVLTPTANATRSTSAVSIDVKVLAVPGTGLRDLGLFFPEGSDGPTRPPGFAIVLPEGEGEALAKNTDTIAIHSLKLPPSSGTAARFRVEARTAVTESFPVSPPYFEVSLGFEVTPRPALQQRVALTTASVVQIRRGPGASGSVAPLLFETQPMKHDVQVPEGKSILLGGLFTAADAARLPDIAATPESPILQYVLSKTKTATDPEIVVLLTPRLIEMPEKSLSPVPRITEAVPPQPVSRPPAVAVQPPAPVAAQQPRPVDLQPVISALVTTPEVVAPPLAMVTPHPAPPLVLKPAAPMPKRNAPSAYSVQVGAFKNSAKADALAERLEKDFSDVFVEEIVESTTPYRVRVGRLSNMTAARQLKQRLTQRGINSFVVLPETR